VDAALLETPSNPSNGKLAPGLRDVTAKFTQVNTNIVVPDAATYDGVNLTQLTITKEDDPATYTGPLFVSTSSPTSTTADVLLTATVQDITAVLGDPAWDPNPGDIRNAVVRFVNRDNNNSLLCTAPVGLVNPLDTKTGRISCSVTLSSGTTGSQSYTVGIIVDDFNNNKSYYIRNSSVDNAVVTVSQAVPGMITGGGYLQMDSPNTKSAGQYPGTAGLKTNFGFNVKYNKSGKNLQGNLNFIIRSGGRVYQIKANAMDSLGISLLGGGSGCPNGGTAAAPCQAVFTSKANLADITDPLINATSQGNLYLIANMTDRGEPGKTDTFAITLYDGNTLLFSSNWDGAKTIEQPLGGGNTVVH